MDYGFEESIAYLKELMMNLIEIHYSFLATIRINIDHHLYKQIILDFLIDK